MQVRCYFCDAELTGMGHSYKVGMKEEYICEKCQVKMINRRSALGKDGPATP